LVLINFLGLYPNAKFFWSDSGTLPIAIAKGIVYPHILSLFWYLPPTDTVMWTLYGLTIASALCLMVGFYSRFQAILLYVLVVSFDHRNIVPLDGQDSVMRIIGFMLIFFPMDKFLSVDRTRRLLKGKASEDTIAEPWAIRTLQVWICFMVFSSALWKEVGTEWVDGTALYYVSRLEGFVGRFPVPHFIFEYMALTHLVTWSVLAVEGLSPILLWFRETRLVALGAILAFDLGCDYWMNLYLFHYLMILGWSTFLSAGEMRWCVHQVAGVWRRLGTKTRQIRYDHRSAASCRLVTALKECDVFGLFYFENADSAESLASGSLSFQIGAGAWRTGPLGLLRCLAPFPTAWPALPWLLMALPKALSASSSSAAASSERAA
jgi:hypothetical protein